MNYLSFGFINKQQSLYVTRKKKRRIFLEENNKIIFISIYVCSHDSAGNDATTQL